MKWKRTELLTNENVWLDSWDADEEIFVRMFRECWARLPSSMTQKIGAYWNSFDGGDVKVELSNMWKDAVDSFAQVRKGGYAIRFDSDSMPVFPRKAAIAVIVHELAHVYQKAIGRQPGGVNEVENEDEANQLMREWGFERKCLDFVKSLLSLGMEFSEACAAASKHSDCQCVSAE